MDFFFNGKITILLFYFFPPLQFMEPKCEFLVSLFRVSRVKCCAPVLYADTCETRWYYFLLLFFFNGLIGPKAQETCYSCWAIVGKIRCSFISTSNIKFGLYPSQHKIFNFLHFVISLPTSSSWLRASLLLLRFNKNKFFYKI